MSLRAPLTPPALLRTWKGDEPSSLVRQRASELPGIVALPIRALTPWLPETIWSPTPEFGPTDTTEVRTRTRARVAAVDWSRIKAGETVNVLANPHGFALCGEAYVAMLEEIVHHLRDENGAAVRVRIAESMGHIENPDWIAAYRLDERFDDVAECPQIDRGTEITTRLGRFWVNRALFACDHFVHTHVTEMREGYLHRMIDRLYKPFGMGYTRVETRSGFHFGFGPRTGMLVARAVFESDFVQERYAGTCVLETSPEGVVDVDADADLGALDRRVATDLFRNYATLVRLMAEIDECTVVFDGHGNTVYCYAGGIPFDVLYYANCDWLDLDNPGLFESMLPDSFPGKDEFAMGANEAVRCYVINYMAGGVPYTYLIDKTPVLVVGRDVSRLLLNDPSNPWLGRYSAVCDDLPGAMLLAHNIAKTENVMIYDGTAGAMHVSEPLGEHLLARAPAVAEDVEQRRMPKWLAQRDLA
jgi:hypothetical protein